MWYHFDYLPLQLPGPFDTVAVLAGLVVEAVSGNHLTATLDSGEDATLTPNQQRR